MRVLFFIVTTFLTLAFIGTVFSQEYSCDYIVDKEKLLGGKPNCGGKQCLCVGNIAKCVGNRTTHVLPRIDPESPVEELFVECYGMQNLNHNSLVNIEKLNLKSLHFQRNEISNISENIFKTFENLTTLEISDNAKINKQSLYTALGSLKKHLNISLTFQNIGIENFTEAFYENLNKSNIINLSLANNRIKTLNFTLLSQLTNLQELRLNKNWINETLGWEQLKNLHTLDLGLNELKFAGLDFCSPEETSVIPNIKKLVLSNNLLSKLKRQNLRSWDCLTTLEELNLRNNTMKTLFISFFSNMTSLQMLDVGSNWIQHVELGDYPPKLKAIDFRNNQFVAFPPSLCAKNSSTIYPNLQELNFSRNYIQKLLTDNWACLPNITKLDFSKNDVSEIRNNTFINFTSLTALYVDNMIPWVKKIEPAAFNSSSLKELSLRFDWIDFSKKEVQNIFKFCPNVKKIDISYNYFISVNEATIADILSPMKNLEVLKAQRISLKKFPASFLLKFKKLQYLDINRNLLDTIQFDKPFNNPNLNLSIRYISAAEGDINSIDQSAFPTSIMRALNKLDLSDNEFGCNCNLLWFRDNVKNNKVGEIELLKWPDRYICRSPTSLVGTLVKGFKPDEQCWHMQPITIAFIAAGSSLFVFTVLSVTAYFNRWYIQYYWYRFTRRRREAKSKEPEEQHLLDEIQYDGFVVYNEEDGGVVHHEFIELMEKRFNYKLHIWKRNAANGNIVDIILDAMYASKNVIVIVSKNLMKDHWCKFQVDVAIHRSIELSRKNVLLVILENINLNAVSKTWCVLLTRMPTARWSCAKDGSDIKRNFFELTVKEQLGQPLNNISNGCLSVGVNS